MSSIYNTLLLRYQNYLIEFYQLIEDKEVTKPSDLQVATAIKNYLENLPEFNDEFEIAMTIKTTLGDLQSIWTTEIGQDGFSVRSYTLDGLDELDEWYFHYHAAINEFEGNLFTDGDWDLFLEEIAEIDTFGEKKVEASFIYKVN